MQGGRVSIVVVCHPPAAAVAAHLDREPTALHLAVLVQIGSHAAWASIVGAVVVPQFNAETVILWPRCLEVSSVNMDARVDVSRGA